MDKKVLKKTINFFLVFIFFLFIFTSLVYYLFKQQSIFNYNISYNEVIKDILTDKRLTISEVITIIYTVGLVVILFFKDKLNISSGHTRWITLFAISTIYFGFIGFLKSGLSINESLYQTISLFSFAVNFTEDFPNPNFALNIARYLAAITTFTAIFIVFASQLLLKLKIRLLYNDHIIICGLSNKAFRLINDILKNDKESKIVVIEVNPNNRYIGEIKSKKVTVIIGNACDISVLNKAGVNRASYLIALTDKDETNIQIVSKAANLPQLTKLHCFSNVEDTKTLQIMKRQQIFNINYDKLDARVFNIYQLGSREILKRFPPDKLLNKNDMYDDICVILVGEGQFFISMLGQMARFFHFPNLKPTKVIIITDDKQTIEANIKNNYPNIDKILDLEYISLDDLRADINKYNKVKIMYICFDEDFEGLDFMTKVLQLEIDKYVKVIFCFSQQTEITKEFEHNTFMKYIGKNPMIETYALLDEVCKKEVIINSSNDEFAKAIHQCYRKSQQDKNNSLPEWDKLDEIIRDSNRYLADHWDIKRRYLEKELGEESTKAIIINKKEIPRSIKERLDIMEHRRWVAEKYMEGFCYGKVKDIDRRHHHLLLDWEDLKDEDKEKDDTIINCCLKIECNKLNNKK